MQTKTVFQARGITKVYQVGETDVHALRGVNLDLYQGELMVLTLVAIPVGFVIGRQICSLIAVQMNSDLYRIPLIIESGSYAFSAAVVLVSAILSGLIIWVRLKRLNLVAVLKARE